MGDSSIRRLCGICDQPAVSEIAPGKPVCANCLAMPVEVRRTAGLRRMMRDEGGNEPVWHYLSFVDRTGFLGVCWVKAQGFLSACSIAHERGCNPGGEVQGLPLPDHGEPPAGSAYVLHTDKAVIDRFCEQWQPKGRN